MKTEDGRPYGPIKYKQIIKDCFYITKNTSTSFNEVLKISPTEREMLLGFLVEEGEKTKEAIEKAKAEAKAKKR